MPSPIGHAAAGVIVALAGEKNPPASKNETRILFLSCMLLAAIPDLDWLVPGFHRGPTHSLGAAGIVTLCAIGASRWATGRILWRDAILCGLAYASHILMDWLGHDQTTNPGVMAFWPFSHSLFYSGLDWFRSTERVGAFVSPQLEHNLRTLVQETLTLGPILLVLLWRRRQLRR
jgi:membrane-bound metal-dependent hydrolase YbcI (DUF457 family)